MNMRKFYKKSFGIALTAVITILLFTNCSRNSMEGMIVFTQASPGSVHMDSLTGGNWRYFGKSRIVALDPSSPGKISSVLTDGFYAARAPEISFDGKKMLFAGQRNEGDYWQIYEEILGQNDARLVIKLDRNCTDPAYLPDGNIIFSSRDVSNNSKSESTLYTCGLNGCCLSRIAYHPNSDFASSVLNDGRVVFISWQVFPVKENPEYLVMRPDGTKAALYYKGGEGSWLNGRIRETNQGNLVFVESRNPSMDHGSLVMLKSSRPLSSRQEISGNADGSFYSVYPGLNGNLIVSYKNPGADSYGIFEFDPSQQKILNTLYSAKDYNSVEPVVVSARVVPRNLPTEVNVDKTTGFLMCMNSDFSTMAPYPVREGGQKAKFVRIMGLNGLIKEIPLEEDGSFFVDISSDVPIRFITVNESGEILRGPSAWVWMRPNERRGCTGCHENREMAPENRVAMAIKKLPVEVAIAGTKHAEEGSKGLEHN